VPASNLTVESDGNGNIDALERWVGRNGGAVATDSNTKVSWRHYSDVPRLEKVATNDGVIISRATYSFTFNAFDECNNDLDTKTTASFSIVDTTKPAFVSSPAVLTTLEADGNGNLEEYSLWIKTASGAAMTDVGFTDGKCENPARRGRRQSQPCYCDNNLNQPVCVGGSLEFKNACLAWCNGHVDFALSACDAIDVRPEVTDGVPTAMPETTRATVETTVSLARDSLLARSQSTHNGARRSAPLR